MPNYTKRPVDILVNGTDRTSSAVFDKTRVEDVITSSVNTATVTLYRHKNDADFGLAQLQEVLIVNPANHSERYFGGIIRSITDWEEGDYIFYELDVPDFSWFLEHAQALVSGTYTNQADNTIIAGFLATTNPDIDATTYVQNVGTIAHVEFDQVTPRAALEELAKQLNADWYLDYDKKLHWFERTAASAPVAPFLISDDPSGDGGQPYRNLKREIPAAEATKVEVTGAGSVAATVTGTPINGRHLVTKMENRDITSAAQATDYGQALVRELGSNPTYSCRVFEPGLRSGQWLRIINHVRGIDDSVVINRVTWRFLSPDGYLAFDIEAGQFIPSLPEIIADAQQALSGGSKGGAKAGGAGSGGVAPGGHGHTGGADGPQLGDGAIDPSDPISGDKLAITLDGVSWPGTTPDDIDLDSPNMTIQITPDDTNKVIHFDVVAAELPYTTPAIALGTAAAEGTANSVIRSDATIVAFDTTVPAALGTAATGSASVAARRDHVHPMPDLGDLTDVVITSPGDNEILVYDSASGDWINQTLSEAGAGLPAGVNKHTLRYDGSAWIDSGTLQNDGSDIGIATAPSGGRLHIGGILTTTPVGLYIDPAVNNLTADYRGAYIRGTLSSDVTSVANLYIDTVTGVGVTVSGNAYGIYIADVSASDGGTNYAIYSAGDKAIFTGGDIHTQDGNITITNDSGYLTLEPKSNATAGNTDVDSPVFRLRAREWTGAGSAEMITTIQAIMGGHTPTYGYLSIGFDGTEKFQIGWNYQQVQSDPSMRWFSGSNKELAETWTGVWYDANLINSADNTVFSIRNQDATYKAGLAVEGKTVIGSASQIYPTTSAMLTVSGNAELNDAGIVDFTLYNTSGSDTDGSRGTVIVFKGKTGAGSAHSLAETWVVHDGTGADTKGRIEFYTNDGTGVGNKYMYFDSANNLLLGTFSIGTGADTVIGIANGTPPSSSPADMVQLYAKDVAMTSELFVRDEAGNETQLSPHDPLTGEWVFRSTDKDGRTIKIHMECMMRQLNDLLGGGFIEESIAV